MTFFLAYWSIKILIACFGEMQERQRKKMHGRSSGYHPRKRIFCARGSSPRKVPNWAMLQKNAEVVEETQRDGIGSLTCVFGSPGQRTARKRRSANVKQDQS
jgi:hypothetical protein